MIRPVLAALALLLSAHSALASPVGVDGVLGAEWAGFTPKQVGFSPSAPVGNFDAPTNLNHVAPYSIYLRSDANFVYGLVTVAPGDAAAVAGLVFANLYFDTNPFTASGSDLGIEVTNARAFRPGLPGYSDLTGTGFEFATSATGVEFALPLSYLRTDPQGVGFPAIGPGNSFLRLNLSQSFGYSVAGGQADYGTERLGLLNLSPVPEPATCVVFAAMLGGLGLRLRRRA
jgi:hypothetical protein